MGQKVKKEYRIAAADFETDPFKYNRVPRPFCVGVYDGSSLWRYWGDDCVAKFLEYIEDMPETIFYFHNGGKFDLHFLIGEFRGDLRIINRRIVKAKIRQHEFRDSFSILPVPLAKFAKEEIDYDKFERAVRHKYKAEIMEYLGSDCVNLWNAIMVFIEEFQSPRGIKLTMASAAMSALKQFHSFDTFTEADDAMIRPYYFGGRNQCFKTGIIRGDYTIYDVNSMYPFAMKTFKHPIGTPTDYGGTRINSRTYFAKVQGVNYGALPQRAPDGSLSFTAERGVFFASIHELEAAEETGTFKIEKVLETVEFDRVGSFDAFVDHFYKKRLEAVLKEGKDGPHVTLYKLIMNGCYGKFAQNPDKFMDYIITCNELPEGDDWLIAEEIYDWIIWEKPTETIYGNSYYNVATGASITGASRALLLRGIHKAVDPIYCDTDSVIARSLELPCGDGLGEWKIEGKGNTVAITGKKTYCVMQNETCVKKASKGVKLSAKELMRTANGEEVEFPNPVPNFRLRIASEANKRISSGKPVFVTRRIRRTG